MVASLAVRTPKGPVPLVRILNERDDGFVEFVFSFDDPNLGVELILPRARFNQFCTDNRVRFVTPEQARAADRDASKWRFGQPGLAG